MGSGGPRRWRLKTIQTLGFCVFAVAFAAFALIFTVTQEEIVRFVSLLVLNGVLGFGPNLTTYIYPTQCFPAEIRSTFHGISAALGKARIGSVAFVDRIAKIRKPKILYSFGA